MSYLPAYRVYSFGIGITIVTEFVDYAGQGLGAESAEAFGESLGPILAQLGVDVGEPDIMPMHNHIS